MKYIIKNKNVNSILTTHFIDVCKKLDKHKMIENHCMETKKNGHKLDYLYELKKEVIRQDPKFKFINSYNNYIFRILTLLDYLDVSKEYDTESHGKTVHMICRETRDIKRIDPLWKINPTSIIEFINSTLSASARK